MTRLITFFRMLGSAARAGSAVEAGRAPVRADLERLGIDANAFAGIARA